MNNTSSQNIVFGIIDNATATLRHIAEGLKKMTTPIKAVNDGIKRMNESFEALNKHNKEMGKFSKAFGGSSEMLGTLGLAYGFDNFIHSTAHFQYAMANVRANMGLTQKQYEALSQSAQHFSSISQFSSSETADAMVFLSKQVKSTNQLIGMMPSVLKLASANNIELGDSAYYVSDMMSTYSIPLNHVAETVDQLTSVLANGGNVTIENMGDALRYAGQAAGALKIPFAQAGTALAILSRDGVQGSQAGMAIKNGLLALTKNNLSQNAIDALRGMHIKRSDLFDPQNHLKSLNAFVNTFKSHASEIGNLSAIFGSEAVAPITGLLAKSEQYFSLLNKVNHSQGLAGKRIKDFSNTALFAMKRLTSAFANLQVAIASSGILTFFTEVVHGLTTVTNFVSHLDAGVKVALFSVLGMVTAISVLKLAVTALSGSFSVLFSPIGLIMVAVGGLILLGYELYKHWRGALHIIISLLVGVVAPLSIVIYLVKTFSTVVKIFGAIMQAIGISFETTLAPITIIIILVGLLVAALVTGGYLIYKHWHQITKKLLKFFNWIKHGIVWLYKAVSNFFHSSNKHTVVAKKINEHIAKLPKMNSLHTGPTLQPKHIALSNSHQDKPVAHVKVTFHNAPQGTRIETKGHKVTTESALLGTQMAY